MLRAPVMLAWAMMRRTKYMRGFATFLTCALALTSVEVRAQALRGRQHTVLNEAERLKACEAVARYIVRTYRDAADPDNERAVRRYGVPLTTEEQNDVALLVGHRIRGQVTFEELMDVNGNCKEGWFLRGERIMQFRPDGVTAESISSRSARQRAAQAAIVPPTAIVPPATVAPPPEAVVPAVVAAPLPAAEAPVVPPPAEAVEGSGAADEEGVTAVQAVESPAESAE